MYLKHFVITSAIKCNTNYIKFMTLNYLPLFSIKIDLRPLVLHPESFDLWNCILLNIPYYPQNNKMSLNSSNDK